MAGRYSSASFSLVDETEGLLLKEMKYALGGSRLSKNIDDDDDDDDYDKDLLLHRLGHTTKSGSRSSWSRLRIGMTDRRRLPAASQTLWFSTVLLPPAIRRRGYAYVDGYRDVRDIVAAAVMSSYVPPGITGPIGFEQASRFGNLAIKRSSERLEEMERLGFVRHETTLDSTVVGDNERAPERPAEDFTADMDATESSASRAIFLDGGLVNAWPVVDDETLVVSPIEGKFGPNPYICPSFGGEGMSHFPINDRVDVAMCRENLWILRYAVMSSSQEDLESHYSSGYEDATRVSQRPGPHPITSLTEVMCR